jgi:hypothetical protein
MAGFQPTRLLKRRGTGALHGRQKRHEKSSLGLQHTFYTRQHTTPF